MKQNQWKLAERLAAVLMVVLLVVAGFQGGRAFVEFRFWAAKSWQDQNGFERMLRNKVDEVILLVNHTLQLEDGENLSYVERQQLKDSVEEMSEELSADHTWFRYQIRSADGKKIYFTNAKNEELEEVVQKVHYASFTKESTHLQVDAQITVADGPIFQAPQVTENEAVADTVGKDELVVEYGVPNEVTEQIPDAFYDLYRMSVDARANFSGHLKSGVQILTAAGVALLLVLFLAGMRTTVPDYKPGALERLWLELVLLLGAGIALLAAFGVVLLDELVVNSFYYGGSLLGAEIQSLVPAAAGGLAAVLGLCAAMFLHTLTIRLCTHTLIRTTMLYRLCTGVHRGVAELTGAIPVVWRVVLAFGVLAFIDLLAFTDLRYSGFYIVFWIVVNGGVLLYLCRWTLCFRRLREGCQTISAGNLNHQIDTAKMPPDLRDHGEDLNNISMGLSNAVDEKIKSERFKAELITNVSHDLKTPLTSIINYVNLLKTTEQTDPRALEFIEVLDRKSQRLKKLTEDLVEASKASTGVLSVNREKIGMSQLLSQAMGEWEEKLKERSLSVVTNLPESETWVFADGRHLWRVIDNLLSNSCKYAMEGTRIYIDLYRNKGQVTLAVKNVSREPLNIPAERLLERFVRGEESRSTEGSGLGLSIARSLTELQGGTFTVTVDGDLFKAAVTLHQST